VCGIVSFLLRALLRCLAQPRPQPVFVQGRERACAESGGIVFLLFTQGCLRIPAGGFFPLADKGGIDALPRPSTTDEQRGADGKLRRCGEPVERWDRRAPHAPHNLMVSLYVGGCLAHLHGLLLLAFTAGNGWPRHGNAPCAAKTVTVRLR